MARRLASFVHLSVDGRVVSYGPDDTVPAKHAKLITNEKAWAADDEQAEPDSDDESEDDSDDDQGDDEGDGDSNGEKPPTTRRRRRTGE